MTELNRQPEDQSDLLLDAPVALREDLVALFDARFDAEAGLEAGAKVDGTPLRHSLADAAHAHFADADHEAAPIRAWWARWPVSTGAGMAAAIGLVVWINSFAPVQHNEPNPAGIALAGDVDRNGKVDILDAYHLQRSIESSMETGNTLASEWDVTGDGRVNRDDVTAVAMLAVKVEGGRRS